MIPTRREELVESIHGKEVADPYRWLEDGSDPEVLEWVEEQNRVTRSYLDQFPGRRAIKKRLTELWNYPKYSLPLKRAGCYFYWKNEGLKNQPVFYRERELRDCGEVILDPNELSADGTVAVSGIWVSEDAAHMAYSVTEAGSDHHKIRIRDLTRNVDYPEQLRWCRFSSVVWADSQSFYYTRFPAPGTVPEGEEILHHRIYLHRLGTCQKNDELVYERPENRELIFSIRGSDDREYLILSISRGAANRNRLYFRPLTGDGEFRPLFDENDASYTFIGNVGPIFYVLTNHRAPRGKIIAVDIHRPERERWVEITSDKRMVLTSAKIIGDRLALIYMDDAHHRVIFCDLNGTLLKEFGLPFRGTVTGISGRQDEPEFFLGFTSFLQPQICYRFNLTTGKRCTFGSASYRFDSEIFITRQVCYTSRDGTKIPMFITHRKDLELNGKNPALLYGYGGFRISITPTFSPEVIFWLEQGGIYAVANLRGGGEYGKDWHRAGMKSKKQNVFDDFKAAAEWLVAAGYTNPNQLAIQGGSNGGLLVAACMVQAPDLFGAVLCHVPLTDMLRFHKFTVGGYWTGEYGNPDNAEDFLFLYEYSPLHNIKSDGEYPPTLILTADTDDRVVPAHARKFAAALQSAQNADAPILLRTEKRAGHGHGKPTEKSICEALDLYSFLFSVLDRELNVKKYSS